MPDTYREFDTWATRDKADGKLEYANFINPLCDYNFAEYMKTKQIIGWQYRRWDNRQKWIPHESLFDSLVRHTEILKLIYKWYDVYECLLNGEVVMWVFHSWTAYEVPSQWYASVIKKDIISELNAIRFNSEALKLHYLNNI